jgi:hypothetical protein
MLGLFLIVGLLLVSSMLIPATTIYAQSYAVAVPSAPHDLQLNSNQAQPAMPGNVARSSSRSWNVAAAAVNSTGTLSVTWYHACGIRPNGSLVCWGDTTYGKSMPPSGTFSQVDLGMNRTCAMRTDSMLACWGDNYFGQTAAPAGSFSQLSTGGDHSCALRADNSLICWGDNSFGQSAVPPRW